MFTFKGFILGSFLAVSVATTAQTTMKVAKVEEGVSYPTIPFASTNVPCYADNFSNSIDWGDGSGKIAFTFSEVPHIVLDGKVTAAVPGGPYNLYSNHVYATAGLKNVTLFTTIHCYKSGAPDTTVTATATILVIGRTEIGKLSFLNSPVPHGSPASLRVEMAAPAQECGERVTIDLVNQADQKYFDTPFPFEFSIPFPGNITEVTISTKNSGVGSPVKVRFKGTSTGQPQFAELTIK